MSSLFYGRATFSNAKDTYRPVSISTVRPSVDYITHCMLPKVRYPWVYRD